MSRPAGGVVVLAVCGLRVEARVASGSGVVTVAGGGQAASLADAIERALDAGAGAVISFGVAGALSPDLRPGDLVIADRIAGPDADYSVDPRWAAVLRSRLPQARIGGCAGSGAIVGDPADKRRLCEATGAIAVDMESHVAARIAQERGLRFAALRAVTDAVDRRLPPAARIAMREGGGIDLAAVVRSIVAAPGQLPALIGIALDTRKALGALGRGRRLLGARLGHPDLDQLPVDVV